MKTERFLKEVFESIITSADVIFQVLDARNPQGTRNLKLEEFVHKKTPEKKIFLIINKIDLIPKPILEAWIRYFKKTTPYSVYGLSALYSRGILTFKKTLSHLFKKRQTKAIIVGYPNTGKSSLIKAFTGDKKKIGISSRAGFTRGIIEIKITQNFQLLDTPGIIPLSEDNEIDQAIKGVINPEKILDKEAVVQTLFELYITPNKVLDFYGVDEAFIQAKLPESADVFIQKYVKNDVPSSLSYSDFEHILYLIGNKRGELKSGGEVDESRVLNAIIHAWQKNKIKYYISPPMQNSV